jgi:hypothetical protein
MPFFDKQPTDWSFHNRRRLQSPVFYEVTLREMVGFFYDNFWKWFIKSKTYISTHYFFYLYNKETWKKKEKKKTFPFLYFFFIYRFIF